MTANTLAGLLSKIDPVLQTSRLNKSEQVAHPPREKPHRKRHPYRAGLVNQRWRSRFDQTVSVRSHAGLALAPIQDHQGPNTNRHSHAGYD